MVRPPGARQVWVGAPRIPMSHSRLLTTLLVTALAVGVLASPAAARMKSTKIEGGLCLTEGGGRFVKIPGFPGERIDRRLLRDVRWLRRNYRIFVTDGFSTSAIHSAKGEHPLGLGLDIVPNTAAGGTWAQITELARFAEPRKNSPISPFRWVGYNGDANHGRGHHLHLSWAHSPGRFGKPVRSVYTMRCPRPKRTSGGGGGDGDGDGGGGGGETQEPAGPTGGTDTSEPTPTSSDGGIEARLAPRAPETDGVG